MIIGIFFDSVTETLMLIDFPIAFSIESERKIEGFSMCLL